MITINARLRYLIQFISQNNCRHRPNPESHHGTDDSRDVWGHYTREQRFSWETDRIAASLISTEFSEITLPDTSGSSIAEFGITI